MTNLRSRAKTLLISAGDDAGLILGYNIRQNPRKVLANAEGLPISVAGTCTGQILLCDNSKAPGTIALANPATGEGLVLLPLPCADISMQYYPEDWHTEYGFAHHQTTGRYKVGHLSCCFDRLNEFDTLQVFV